VAVVLRAFAIATLIHAALTHAPLSAQSPVPAAWFGTWALNVTKSTYVPGPPPYRRATYTIEPAGDGLRVAYDMVLPRGGVNHLEWTGKIDGRDYAVQGVGEPITYAYVGTSDGGHEVLVKLDSRVIARSTIRLSPDGRTMTTVTEGTDAQGRLVRSATVYEKRETRP